MLVELSEREYKIAKKVLDEAHNAGYAEEAMSRVTDTGETELNIDTADELVRKYFPHTNRRNVADGEELTFKYGDIMIVFNKFAGKTNYLPRYCSAPYNSAQKYPVYIKLLDRDEDEQFNVLVSKLDSAGFKCVGREWYTYKYPIDSLKQLKSFLELCIKVGYK